MTYNELVQKISSRVNELVMLPLDELRSMYPETTDTQAQLVKHCKMMRTTKGEIIQAILDEEFTRTEDREIILE